MRDDAHADDCTVTGQEHLDQLLEQVNGKICAERFQRTAYDFVLPDFQRV
jgi:hypothetical protein